MAIPGITLIGDRINPEGFKATRALLEAQDLPGLQALAQKQVNAGAQYLDITIGPRGYKDSKFLEEVIRAIQAAVDVPLCFDYPSAAVQEVCLKAYDPAKARGQRPIVNSLAETRPEILDLLKIRPFKVVVMGSERLEDGAPKSNKQAQEVVDLAKRLVGRLRREHNFSLQDIFIDVTIHSIISDTEGLSRMALDSIRAIGQDPDLKGVHIMGGMTNIGNMLPPLKFDGLPLRQLVENSFLTLAVPMGFDTIMGTPWNNFQFLPDDNLVLRTYKQFIELKGLDAMRCLRKLWAQGSRPVAAS